MLLGVLLGKASAARGVGVDAARFGRTVRPRLREHAARRPARRPGLARGVRGLRRAVPRDGVSRFQGPRLVRRFHAVHEHCDLGSKQQLVFNVQTLLPLLASLDEPEEILPLNGLGTT